MSKYESSDTNIEAFVINHKLQKQADELWGEGWEADGDDEMIESLLESIGETNYIVPVDKLGKIDVVYNYYYEEEQGDEIDRLKKTLRLALLQLQDYSDNELIVADGEIRNIQEELDKLQ
jgi:hypothetical protein